MWRLTTICAVLLGFSCSAFSQQILVTTWNLKWFPSGTPTTAAQEVESKRIQGAADTLRKINPDVIVLQEIRDLATCEKLAAALKPSNYSVAVCSRFKDDFGGGLGWQQVAILSKSPAVRAWSEKWKSFGVVDPPRGFAFATFRIGTNDLAVYGLHLKSNLVRGNAERQNQLNILKRELSVEQVLNHLGSVEAQITNKFELVVVAGDLNTNPDQALFVSENTLRLLSNAGYTSGFENARLPDRITHPGSGRYPSCTFDYIFVKGTTNVTAPVITSSIVSDHLPVTRTLRTP